eukprot:CAMPEP_0184743804 /NCGR_PEP_ID=MMETSP0315-20130426/6598_1 /TAXON_ID=101924 /ORGANISM="Rhodosorus marinus, Strain UTEX LB 2760" /LENGTH=395 /DNA_ID=CAMNT_0027215221 /DNA_START=161 /DNA_END=1348 /DNA_ORIENTATION=+
MAAGSYTTAYMTDQLNNQNISMNRLPAGQSADFQRHQSSGAPTRMESAPFLPVLSEQPRPRPYTSVPMRRVSGNHEMERNLPLERHSHYPPPPLRSANTIHPYGYEPVGVPEYVEDRGYKNVNGSEDVVHHRPVTILHGGRSPYYNFPGYSHPLPPQPSFGGSEQTYNPEAQISQLLAYVSEFQQINVRLQDELYQARHKIEALKKQINEYSSADREKNDTSKSTRRYWSTEEHKRFLEAVEKFGQKDVRAIANYVGSRNPTQVRTHAQKYFLKLQRKPTAEAGSSQGAEDERILNQRRCMSEGDLFRVRHQEGLEAKEEEGEDDSEKESGRDSINDAKIPNSSNVPEVVPNGIAKTKKDVKSVEIKNEPAVALAEPKKPLAVKPGKETKPATKG